MISGGLRSLLRWPGVQPLLLFKNRIEHLEGLGMHHCQARQSTQTFSVLVIFIFAVVVLQGIAIAKHQPKTYPESGKVIAGGLNQLTVDGPAMGSAGGSVQTKYTHTYKVQTEGRVYDLDSASLRMLGGATGRGGVGPKPLEIGDVIHFRTEKGSAYIPLPDGSEQKLRILHEELRPEAKSTDEKPVDARQ